MTTNNYTSPEEREQKRRYDAESVDLALRRLDSLSTRHLRMKPRELADDVILCGTNARQREAILRAILPRYIEMLQLTGRPE